MSSGHVDKPRPCSCFNGYCYRSLCAEKVVDRALKQPESVPRTPKKKSKHPPILVWRKDLTEEAS